MGKFGIDSLIQDTTAQQQEVKEEKLNTSTEESQKKPKSENEKVNYYLHPDMIEKLNDLQSKIRKETKTKPSLSALVSEALEDLFIKHGI
jgi:hypothetical protein